MYIITYNGILNLYHTDVDCYQNIFDPKIRINKMPNYYLLINNKNILLYSATLIDKNTTCT